MFPLCTLKIANNAEMRLDGQNYDIKEGRQPQDKIMELLYKPKKIFEVKA